MASGVLYKPTAHTKPPLPRTGYSHPDCYLNLTNDCSKDLSGEHYMSRGVLDVLPGPGIVISGFPWLGDDQSKTVSINSLTANILCQRHNSALSPLDAEAARFFGVLRAIDLDFSKRSLSTKTTHHIFGGPTLEMWMAKVACGFMFSRIAHQGECRMIDTHIFDKRLATEALLAGTFLPPAGLYLNMVVGSTITTAEKLDVTMLTMDDEPRVIGSRIRLRNHSFEIVIDGRGVRQKTEAEGVMYHPSELIFTDKKRAHIVNLAWPMMKEFKSVTITGQRPREQDQARLTS